MAFANPLNWPAGWPRNNDPDWPTFKASSQTTMTDLEKVLDALECINPVITTNQPLRLDGGLRTAQGTAADAEIVRAAWRRLIARYHPDNQETGSPLKFDQVQKAYKESGAA